MKEQMSLRVSKATKSKIESLAAIHGTQTEAVAVAIERLYQQEITERSKTMHIKVEYSAASVFGDVDPEAEGWNERASLAQFGESLENHLYDKYPEAEITVIETINDRVMVDGMTDHDAVPGIEQVIDIVWNGDSWMVPISE